MNSQIILEHIWKSYPGLPVIRDLSLTLTAPDIYCLMSPSGSGKTTLFRLLMGLEKPDRGTVRICPETGRISTVFQEDRLIEFMNPLENILLVLPSRTSREEIRQEAARLLPAESLERPVCTLSGGMRRRCALLRAVLAPSDFLLLDEPFTGLDAATKKEAVRFLLEKANRRLILMASHSREDAAALGALILSEDIFEAAP